MAGLSAPISLDGAHLEGGGVLVRTSLAMSALTQQPVRVFNVRGNAPTPGITAEDAMIARALALACGAETAGGVGDYELLFVPHRRPMGLNETFEAPESPENRHANAMVVLLTLLPVMARTGVYGKLAAKGETYGHNVLSYDYFASVTLGALRRFGLYAYPEMPLAGFGRGSMGEAYLEIEPSALHGIEATERGALIGCNAVVAIGELSHAVGARGVAHLESLAHHAGIPMSVEWTEVKARGPGAFVTVYAEFEHGFGGATAMGRRGLRMESVAQNAFDAFRDWYAGTAAIDGLLADQILLTAAIAEGDTSLRISRITRRLITAIWVVKQFVPIRMTLRGREGEEGLLTIRR